MNIYFGYIPNPLGIIPYADIDLAVYEVKTLFVYKSIVCHGSLYIYLFFEFLSHKINFVTVFVHFSLIFFEKPRNFMFFMRFGPR